MYPTYHYPQKLISVFNKFRSILVLKVNFLKEANPKEEEEEETSRLTMVIGINRPRQRPKIQFIARPISENKIRSTIKCPIHGHNPCRTCCSRKQ
jgi:hypothetical protein